MAVSRINEAGLNVNQYGNRNLIINGAMAVTQRGTSATGLDYGYYTADRMRSSYNGSTSTIYQNVDETVLSSQSVDGSTVNVLKRTYPTNSDTGAHRLNYRIELDDIRPHLGKTLTLSYYAKADVGLTLDDIYFSLGGNVSTFSQAITTSWQRYSHTFTCSSTVGSSTFVDLAIGATASNFSNTSVYYTMLQLEVGDTATPFEHRSYGDELARCQRYLYRIGGAAYTRIGTGFSYNTTAHNTPVPLPVSMRAVPTLTTSDLSGGSTFAVYQAAANLQAVSALVIESGGTDPTHALSINSTTSGLTQGDVGILVTNNNTSAFLQFDAEL